MDHRVDRVPGFLSNRPKWVCSPLTRKRVLFPHPFGSGGGWGVGGGGDELPLAGEVLGAPNSDEGRDTEELHNTTAVDKHWGSSV
jgi:hypothetical protein